MKCNFCDRETVVPWRSLCAACFDEHNRREPEPTATEILAADITDLQSDVAELFRRLSGKRADDDSEEEMSTKERYERMLSLLQAVVAEKRG